MSTFPKRAFIQVFDESLPPDYQLVADELTKRNIPYVTKTTDEILDNPLPLTKDDIVIGNFDWTNIAVKQLGLEMPIPPDYPICLKHLLHRKVWESTLGEVQHYLLENKDSNNGRRDDIFIKPALNAKAFAAIIEPKDGMIDTLINGIPGVLLGLDKSLPVFCAEIVDMISEYRAYVTNGKIVDVVQYRGPQDKDEEGYVALDMTVVNNAVDILFESEEGKELTGCGIDFAILRIAPEEYVTCLVEVNDGFSLGRYEGLSGKAYTDLLIARWEKLVEPLS